MGLAEPSIPIQVPAPREEPQEPFYVPSEPEPAVAPPVHTPAPAEPVPA